MSRITLTGFEELEIKNVSGGFISFEKIEIPNENCSNFRILYKISNQNDLSINSGTIICSVSPYQRDASWVPLNKSFSLPDNCVIKIRLSSLFREDFKGVAFIEYGIGNKTDGSDYQPEKRVFISEIDRENAYRIALKNLGRFFQIKNWEYDNNQTLYDKLKKINPPIFQLVQTYFKAYDEWFKFYQRIKEIEITTDKTYNLSDSEKAQLAELIKARENTLNALQREFDELQLKKFHDSHGLNVEGILE